MLGRVIAGLNSELRRDVGRFLNDMVCIILRNPLNPPTLKPSIIRQFYAVLILKHQINLNRLSLQQSLYELMIERKVVGAAFVMDAILEVTISLPFLSLQLQQVGSLGWNESLPLICILADG